MEIAVKPKLNVFLNTRHSITHIFVAACAVVLFVVPHSAGCELKPEQKSHALSLGFDAFDQSALTSPWRKLASEGKCYKESAELIDYYLSNRVGLRDDQARNLYFHAGQMYATSGDAERSIISFKKSLWAEQPDDFPINWNAYVRGTIAYLMRDRNQFDNVLNTFERELTGANDPDLVNFRVLQKMGMCWGGRYYDVVLGQCASH